MGNGAHGKWWREIRFSPNGDMGSRHPLLKSISNQLIHVPFQLPITHTFIYILILILCSSSSLSSSSNSNSLKSAWFPLLAIFWNSSLFVVPYPLCPKGIQLYPLNFEKRRRALLKNRIWLLTNCILYMNILSFKKYL